MLVHELKEGYLRPLSSWAGKVHFQMVKSYQLWVSSDVSNDQAFCVAMGGTALQEMSRHSWDQFWLHEVTSSSRSKYLCGSRWIAVRTAACLWNVRETRTHFTCSGTWSWSWSIARFGRFWCSGCWILQPQAGCLRCWSQCWINRWWVTDWLVSLLPNNILPIITWVLLRIKQFWHGSIEWCFFLLLIAALRFNWRHLQTDKAEQSVVFWCVLWENIQEIFAWRVCFTLYWNLNYMKAVNTVTAYYPSYTSILWRFWSSNW